MLKRLFNTRRPPSSGSIYEHIKAHAPVDRPGLDEAGQQLPDEADLVGPLRFAPGAMDGIRIAHSSPEANQKQLERSLRLVVEAGRRPDRSELVKEVDRALKDVEFISIVDPLLERIQLAGVTPDAIDEIGRRRLARESTKRNAVKLGIALLGTVSGGDNSEVLLTLGRHEEFTVYSAVALASTSVDPERALWDLARLVDGWGRIETVNRLRNTRRPEIRAWILREGFRNTIMYEYLAYVAATTGGLLAELEKPRVDDEVLTAACEIISALIAGGPAENIDDYDDAPQAIEALLHHLRDRDAKLLHFITVDAIEGFLVERELAPDYVFSADDVAQFMSESRDAWARRLNRGWTPELRERLTDVAREIKTRPEWRDMATRGLMSSDNREFYEADYVARSLGMDVLDAHLQRLHRVSDQSDWYGIMRAVDDRRIDEVLALAERSVKLDEIATGPASELGLGPDFAQHSALDFVVQELRRFPGKGWPLIAAALRSPVTRNRNMAISALDAWDRAVWPEHARKALAEAEALEPDSYVRSGMEALLRGEPLPGRGFEFPAPDEADQP